MPDIPHRIQRKRTRALTMARFPAIIALGLLCGVLIEHGTQTGSGMMLGAGIVVFVLVAALVL